MGRKSGNPRCGPLLRPALLVLDSSYTGPGPYSRKSYKYQFPCFLPPAVTIFRDLENFSACFFRVVSGPVENHSKLHSCFIAMVTLCTVSFSTFSYNVFQMSVITGEHPRQRLGSEVHFIFLCIVHFIII